MAAGKHDRLIKPLAIGLIDWKEKEKSRQEKSVLGPGSAVKEIWLNGPNHLEGMNLSFSWGVHNTLGDWHADAKSHTHSYPECLFFVGLDTANINYLGAEIECSLGNDHRSYAFNEPTVLVIPAGCPHGPISTKRVYSPRGFGFFSVALSPTFDITWVDKNSANSEPNASIEEKTAPRMLSLKSGVITERKKVNPARFTQEQLAHREELEKTGFKPGPGNADHMTWMNGKDLGDLKVNVSWGFCSQPGIWQRGFSAHAHPDNEVLIFLGTDPNNSDSLGAEIEIDLGEEHERHIVDKPSAILCPAGMAHAPIVTRWVDKPFAFILINLADEVTMSIE
jgi:hypothetical protein